MATGSDIAVGYSLISFGVAVFTYYTVWVVILPFVDEGQPIHQFFLPRLYAVLIPIVAGVLALIGIGAFIIRVTLKKKYQKKST